jgi:hypothetical protein
MQRGAQQTNRGKEHISSPFLTLPLEIRTIIYRLLLHHDEPIPRFFLGGGLNPAILRTCRQILSESRPILYGENIFQMKIWSKYGDERASFVKCGHFAERAELEFGLRLKDMRQFEILVEVQCEDEVWGVKSAVRAVSKVLSEFPKLDYLHISLDGCGCFDAQSVSHVLESFTLLRNVRRVVLDGVPPVYAQYLERKMTGSSPLDHLPKMYEALELYAGPFDCCEDSLQEACDAMEEDDVDRFKRVREEIITMVTERMSNARNHLFDHDASS